MSLAQAQAAWHEACAGAAALGEERLAPEQALGRVTARPAYARISSPHYHAAAMDGFAVRSRDTHNASEAAPMRLRVPGQARAINTGEPLPQGADAMVMVEHAARRPSGDEIEVTAAVPPWDNVRIAGEDMVASEMILPAGHVVRPVDVGALLAGGVREVAMRRRPRIAILPTGSEIVQPGEPLRPGSVIEFNSRMLAGMLTEWGCEPITHAPAPDESQAITRAIEAALADADALLILAGVSHGTRDFTAQAIASLGRVLVHGVAIRPGKPVVLGLVGDKPVVGVPGYPVSAALCAELFVQPLVCRWLGAPLPGREVRPAVSARKIASEPGSEEFLRVRLGLVGGQLVAMPVARGAGLVTSLVRADGLARIAAGLEGVPEGASLEVELLRPWAEIERTISVIGSHDLSLDLLGSELGARHPGMRLASTHVGSMSGIAALKKGYCHLSGTHLLDPETGDYNVSYVRRLFGRGEVALVTLAHRQQGLIVPAGNPKGVARWEDLAREDVEIINRQAGAGTRVLLDHELSRRGIEPGRVRGYGRQAFTHLAVASAVASGAADVGVGILAAARALGLDFVPLAVERYELAAPRAQLRDERIQRLLEVLASAAFKKALEGLGGYDTSETAAQREA